MLNVEKIRMLRLSRHMSQAETADAAHISQTMLSKIEMGQCDTTTDVLVGLAAALGVEPQELLARQEPEPEPNPTPTPAEAQGTENPA